MLGRSGFYNLLDAFLFFANTVEGKGTCGISSEKAATGGRIRLQKVQGEGLGGQGEGLDGRDEALAGLGLSSVGLQC